MKSGGITRKSGPARMTKPSRIRRLNRPCLDRRGGNGLATAVQSARKFSPWRRRARCDSQGPSRGLATIQKPAGSSAVSPSAMSSRNDGRRRRARDSVRVVPIARAEKLQAYAAGDGGIQKRTSSTRSDFRHAGVFTSFASSSSQKYDSRPTSVLDQSPIAEEAAMPRALSTLAERTLDWDQNSLVRDRRG